MNQKITTEIKQADSEDLNQLSELFNAYRVFYGFEHDLEGARDFLSQRITQSESVIFVLTSTAGMHGFVQLYPLFSSTRMKRLWLLNDLYVEETSRRKGLAKALINHVKSYAIATNSCGFILETAKTNHEANKLYFDTNLVIDQSHHYYSFDI